MRTIQIVWHYQEEGYRNVNSFRIGKNVNILTAGMEWLKGRIKTDPGFRTGETPSLDNIDSLSLLVRQESQKPFYRLVLLRRTIK